MADVGRVEKANDGELQEFPRHADLLRVHEIDSAGVQRVMDDQNPPHHAPKSENALGSMHSGYKSMHATMRGTRSATKREVDSLEHAKEKSRLDALTNAASGAFTR